MRTITRTNRLALPALALAALFGACGDDGGENGNGGTPMPEDPTEVRFLNFLDVTSNPIDIYLQADLLDPEIDNPSPVIANLAPEAFSDVIELPATTTSFAIVNEGEDATQSQNIIASATGQDLRADVRNLVVLFLVGDARTYAEDLEAPATGARFRFVHLSENYSGSIQLFDAEDNVNPMTLGSSFGVGNTQELDLPVQGEGNFVLGLGPANDSIPEVVFPLSLSNGQAFTAFIRGASTTMEQLVLIDSSDARSTIDSMPFEEPGEATINIVNLADDRGELTVFANEAEAPLASVPFGSGSTPRILIEGSYDLVVEDDAGNEVASLDGFDLTDGDFFTIALYDEPGGDVVIRPIEENDSMPPMGQSRLRVIHIAPDVTMPIDLFDAGANPPVALPNGFEMLNFGDISPALNRTGGLSIGIDADSDERGDLEFDCNSPTLSAGRNVNLFIDSSSEIGGEVTVRVVAQPITGSTQPAVTCSAVPDPSFVRAINLGLLQQSVDFFESSNQFSSPIQSGIRFGDSGANFVQVNANPSSQVFFTPEGQPGTELARGPAELGVSASQTVAFFGTINDYEIAVFDDQLVEAPGPGTVRIRLIHTAVAVGSVSGTFEGQSLGANLSLGEAGPYAEVSPGAEPELTIQAGESFTLSLPNISGGRVYNVFFVNDQQNGQEFVVVQDDVGNTESVFRPAQVRALNLLSDPSGEDVDVVSLRNNQIASDLPQNAVSPIVTVQEGSYPASCALPGGFSSSGNISAAFGDVTTVVCQGFSQGAGGVFAAVEKPNSTALAGEIEWRFANFATNFPSGGGTIDVLDPTDPMNPFAVGVGSNRVPANFQTGSADGFVIAIETAPGMPSSEEVIFEIPALPDQTAYTFYVSNASSPMTLGPIQLVIVSSDPGAAPITVGANGSATFFHASPDVSTIDVFAALDPTAVFTGLGFGDASANINLPGGDTRFDVAPTGQTVMDSIFDFTAPITGRASNTLVVFGEDAPQAAAFTNSGGGGGGGMNDVNVRVLHTASELGRVDLYDVATGLPINNMGMRLWEDLNPGEATSYVTLDSTMPVTVGIDVEETNSGLMGAFSPAYDYFVQLDLVALGAPVGTANIILVQDAATNTLEFRLQLTDPVNQVAPFGPRSRIRLVNVSGADSSVELFLNGSAGPNGAANLGTATDWAPVFPGNQNLEIVTSGQMPGVGTRATLMNANFESGRSYTVVFNQADGGPNILLLDDNYANLGDTETTVRPVHAAPGFGQVDLYNASGGSLTLLAADVDEATAPASFRVDQMNLGAGLSLGVDQDDDPSTIAGATIDAGIFDPGNLLHVILYTDDLGLPQGLVLLSDGFQDVAAVQ